jgi:hypothetical protein
VLARIRSHLIGNAVGYLALFVALGGTSYAVATGSIDSREIKNNAVASKDLRNNGVTARDVRNRSLTGGDVRPDSLGGAQVNEATLGLVPAAASAGDSALLGGLGPGAFARANPAATVDVASAAAPTKVLTLAGLGEVVVKACNTTAPTVFDFAWRNTSDSAQDVWEQSADTDDPALAPHYAQLPAQDPDAELSVALNQGAVVVSTFRVRPTNRADAAATIHLFASVGQPPNTCRVSAQAELSG